MKNPWERKRPITKRDVCMSFVLKGRKYSSQEDQRRAFKMATQLCTAKR